MFILPRTNEDFLKTEYWDTFFKKRGKEAFEWYGEYQELCGILHHYIKPADSILVIGCGNSTVSSNLYDLGYKKITNIDVSNVVIKRMQQKYGKSRPGLRYLRMDALDTEFENASYSVIFDKGTLDALFPDDTPHSMDRISRLFDEIDRLLKVGGRYVCISLLQEHILHFVIEYFSQKGWLLRVCRCVEVEKSRADGSRMPVFALVCTKIKKLPNFEPFLEISMDDDNVMRSNKENLIKTVRSIQDAEIVCSGLSRHCLTGAEKEAVIEIARPSDKSTRYTITIIDPEEPRDIEKMSFAAFVVPFGKEKEWMFSSTEGRQILRQNCRVDRVAMISMHSGHEYPDFKGIQDELTDTAIKLAPVGVTARGETVMFLTMSVSSADDESRDIRARDESSFSGKFIVEDVIEDNEHYRRLIFLNRGNVIQSEVKLTNVGDKEDVDFSYLSCEYHIPLNIGISLAICESKKQKCEVLLLGLGGGVLATLIHKFFKEAYITAIEIDNKIYEVAKEHFCLKTDERMRVVIDDGLQYLTRTVKEGVKYDVIIFDVDNKDPTVGISCPPVHFLKVNVLNEVTRCLSDTGIFLLNLVCRSQELRKETLEKLRAVFAGVISIKTTEDVNEVLICWKRNLHINPKHIEKATDNFYKCTKEQNIVLPNNLLPLIDHMENIKL